MCNPLHPPIQHWAVSVLPWLSRYHEEVQGSWGSEIQPHAWSGFVVTRLRDKPLCAAALVLAILWQLPEHEGKTYIKTDFWLRLMNLLMSQRIPLVFFPKIPFQPREQVPQRAVRSANLQTTMGSRESSPWPRHTQRSWQVLARKGGPICCNLDISELDTEIRAWALRPPVQ